MFVLSWVRCVLALTFIHTPSTHYCREAACVTVCLSLLMEGVPVPIAVRCQTTSHLAAFQRRGRGLNKSSTPQYSFRQFGAGQHRHLSLSSLSFLFNSLQMKTGCEKASFRHTQLFFVFIYIQRTNEENHTEAMHNYLHLYIYLLLFSD